MPGASFKRQGNVAAAAAIALACLPSLPALAGTAQAQFGLTLVIAPRCQDPADPSREIAPLVPTVAEAVALAAPELGLAPADLTARHDRLATGWWLVSLNSADAPLLRVEKCTGRVEPPPAR